MITNRPLDLLYIYCFPAFVERAFGIVYPDRRLHESWHVRAVCHYLQGLFEGWQPRNLVLNMPPRRLKTFIVSICFPAWCLIRDPSLSVIVASYGDDLSRKSARQFRGLMESDFVVRLSQGQLADVLKSSETEYETVHAGGRFTTSVGGVLTGRGADILIIDDPMKADEGYSETSRRSVREWFFNAALSRRNRPTTAKMVLSMQRLHMDDLAGALMEQGWPALVLPAIADQDADFDLGGGVFHHRSKGDLLQDGWDSLEDLEHVRRTAGSHVFSAQYQQQPLPPEGNMVKCDWLKTYKSAPKLGECRHVYLACDPSGAVGSNNDYTAIVVAAVAERKVHLLEVRRGHWECLEISRHLREMADHWKPTQIMIETTGMGEAVRQLIDRTHKYDIRGIQQKIDKITRLSRVIARFESNQVLLPREADWLDDFMKEILAFPNGRNDDQVDALLMVLEDLSKREQSEDSIPSIVFPDMWRENPFSADRFTNHGY